MDDFLFFVCILGILMAGVLMFIIIPFLFFDPPNIEIEEVICVNNGGVFVDRGVGFINYCYLDEPFPMRCLIDKEGDNYYLNC